MEQIVKLIVAVPEAHEEKVRLALGKAGAGRIGNYDYCSFVYKGVGHYRPLEGTKPFIGEHGAIADVAEVHIATVCFVSDLPRVLAAMREAHPYEEIAYDIIPLRNHEFAHLVPRKNNNGKKHNGKKP
ncbi:hypothetical protein D6789_01410 [Candidatus Woesearchaeota archaeon]|nr:MAG: hypothetical protein D6789_01410 [Candidatus Woesearchaeota archaeon]